MEGVRLVAVLTGAGLPFGMGALFFLALCAATRSSPFETPWPQVLTTWMVSSTVLGVLGGLTGAWTASRSGAESPVVEGVVLSLAPAGLAAFGALAWGLATAETSLGLAHAGALLIPAPFAAAAAAGLTAHRS